MSDHPYLLGIDLGKATDHTALVLAQPSGLEDRPFYDLRHIERVPLKTRYTAVAEHTKALVSALRRPVDVARHDDVLGVPTTTFSRPDVVILLDYTGVGMAVAEMFLDAQIDCDIVLITITGGMKVTRDDEGVHVPKGFLVSAIQRTLQEGRLRYPVDDPHADLLDKELADFQAIIRPSGTVAYEASVDWRSGKHDDLVLATALAVWYGESRRPVEVW